MIASRRIGNVQEAVALLNCHRLPGRLRTAETAVLLGFQEHDIPALVAGKLLTLLGKPAANAPKYFRGSGHNERHAGPGMAFAGNAIAGAKKNNRKAAESKSLQHREFWFRGECNRLEILGKKPPA